MSFEDLRREYLEYPREISLETQALCNAACTFCPYPTLERKGERMADELVAKIVREMVSWRRPLYFSPFKVNEPLLDKRTLPICREINEHAPWVTLRLFTNGSALTPQNIEAIAGLTRIAHLWVSLNSHIPEEYERLMGLRFEQTARRLDDLHARDFPHTVILSTVGYPNEDFRRYCFERWPKFQSLALKRDGWLGYTDPQVAEIPNTPCVRWFELSIVATGVVSLCCMDGKAEFPLGDTRTQSLYEIYNSPHWRERREKLLGRHAVEPCARCTY